MTLFWKLHNQRQENETKITKNNWQHALDLTSVTPLLILIIFCLNSTLDIPVIVMRGKDSQKRKRT